MTVCQSCDAAVVFVPSAKSGKAMILDAKPEKRVIVGHALTSDEGEHAPAFILDQAKHICDHAVARVVDVYVDHHVTCPKAAEWKGRRR